MNSTCNLSKAQVDAYHQQGYLFPLDVFDSEDVACIQKDFSATRNDAKSAGIADQYDDMLRTRAHMTMPFVHRVASHPELLDRVSSILGPNLMLWGADFFIKKAHSDKIVSWHQDLTYWGLGETDSELTAWVALSDVDAESGCMWFVPGSHKQNLLPHRDTYDEKNLLSRGQEVAVEVNEKDAIDVILKPGQVSFHHGRIFHASGPNRTANDRIGLAFRYITPEVKQHVASRDYTIMMRGVDRGKNWNHLAPPTRNFDSHDLQLRQMVIEDLSETLSEGM